MTPGALVGAIKWVKSDQIVLIGIAMTTCVWFEYLAILGLHVLGSKFDINIKCCHL